VNSNHNMRKPNPGMLDAGVLDHDVDRKVSWMVGDRMTDVEAGRRANMRSVFLAGTEDPQLSKFEDADFYAEDFLELSQYICFQDSQFNA
ncbi:MAG: HAD hydrolase-like protein, partial [Pseudomonadota bacterium]